MGEQSLREFAKQIKQLIDDGRSGEAIPVAQYLLRRYPRYLLGYRLLAEAAIEQGHTRDAVEIFRRVLSADPESYIAHAGLASAYVEEDNLTEALWHMMRAFELKPDMREIRDQLRYLYELRDGRAPGRLHLNRAALARMYMRDGLYDRAIDELQSELAGKAERVDLRTMLVVAQWHAGQRHDAVISANQVLHELPYSLKCNLILGQFYAQDGNVEAAEPALLIARELDPENEVAVQLFGESSYLQVTEVMLESMEDARQRTGMLTGDPEEIAPPEWLADLSLFNDPEMADQEVDWDAIAAYESDWRTILAKATHQAIADFKPNWRVELRRATELALQSYVPPAAPRAETTPETAAPPVADVAPAPERVEEPPAAVEPPRPPRSWVEMLRADSREALARWEAPAKETPPGIWLEALRSETLAELESGAPDARPPEEDWRDDLRHTTDAQLEEAAEPVTQPAAPVQLNGRMPEEPPAWKSSLREATDRLLAAEPPRTATAAETGEPPGPRRVEAGAPDTASDASPHWSCTAAWVERLRATADDALAAYEEAATQVQGDHPAVEEAPEPAEGESLSAITAALEKPEEDLAEEAEEFWSAVTADLSQKDWEDEEITISLPEETDEEAAGQPDEPPALDETPARDRQETAQKPPAGVTAANHRETANGDSGDGSGDGLSALDAARQAWQQGQPKEALAIYQRLIHEANYREEEALVKELKAWTATEQAPALAYQLLGDVYRNLGQMREAVDQYREAINRM